MPNEFAQNAEYGGLVSGVANNHADVRNMESYNTFDRSQTFAQTQRFAEINPIFCNKFNDGDIVPLQSDHELRTYTLASPLLSPLYMHRSFYSVPLKCIYPNTFDIFYKPQIKGMDFPDAAKPRFPLSRIGDLINWLKTYDGTETYHSKIMWMNNLFILLQIMSQDGLLVKLGYGMKNYDFDEIFNAVISQAGLTFQWTRNSDNTAMSMNFGNEVVFQDNLIGARYHLLRLINNKYTLTGVVEDATGNWSQFVTVIRGLPCITGTYYFTNEFITLEKVIAYQLVCAQFFTNSYVDDINTAKKWYDNNMALLYNGFLTVSDRVFSLNGVMYSYDLISYSVLDKILSTISTNNTVSLQYKYVAQAVIRNIFEIHESLKTSDYFNDSRTQPLAVGDVYSAVVSNQVSAIDINHKLWLQRFLNAVNRIPDNINEYLRSIFGEDPVAKEPQPMFISSERFAIGKQEVENTSNTNQGNTVTLLRTEDSRYRFEFKLKDPSIVIGLNSYSIDYCYSSAADRAFYEVDRYENFNPYLQHIGDQPVWRKELVNDFGINQSGLTFGYQMRYAQYKTNINHCSGAFADDELPSWLAIWDKSDAYNYPSLNSDFIRNMNIDFDAFYSSLTGKKLTSYFHFICTFHTSCYVNSKQQKFPSLT